MTGDEIDPKTMIFADETDLDVAFRVRMLQRSQLNHEAVCTGARDRIMYLSQTLERTQKALDSYMNAYSNMRDFAVAEGLDVTVYHGPTVDTDGCKRDD